MTFSKKLRMGGFADTQQMTVGHQEPGSEQKKSPGKPSMNQFKIRATDIDPMAEHVKDKELKFDAPKLLEGNDDLYALFKEDA